MGNSESSERFSHPELATNIRSKYQFRGDLEDERFGKVSIYNHKHDPHQQILFKQRWTNTQEDSNRLHTFIQSRRQLKHKNLTTLPFYEVTEERQMFSTFYRHNMGFEYYGKTLENELENRSKIQEHESETAYSTIKYYSESEIWYIINVLLDVVNTFKDQNYPHGDIQPKNLLIDSDGQMKVIDNLLINYGETGYRKMVFDSSYKAAISPKLMEALKNKVQNPQHNKVKSDIFSIGITALCASNNTDFNRYYDWQRHEILNGVVPQEVLRDLKPNTWVEVAPSTIEDDLLNMNRLGYSQELIDYIRSMLVPEELMRPDLAHLIGHVSNRQIVSSHGPGHEQAMMNQSTVNGVGSPVRYQGNNSVLPTPEPQYQPRPVPGNANSGGYGNWGSSYGIGDQY